MVLMAFPVLTAALFGLAADRHLGAHVYDPANGGAILWQHLFWFFGHPEVYIVALPFFGIITEILPVFSRKPVFGYTTLVYATFVDPCAVDGGVGTPHVRHRRGCCCRSFPLRRI
jgi:cytochrome c oxidase subunit 1